MSTYKNLMTVCAVAALALGLAACGGGGSSSTSGGPGTPPAAGPTVAQLEAAAEMALTTAATAVDAVTDDSDAAAVTAADNAVAAARTAVMAASASGEYAELNRRLGMIQGELAEAKESRMAAMDAKSMADMEAMTAKAKALKKAIETVNGFTTQPAVTTTSIPAFDLDGDGDGTTMSTAITLKKGDAAGMLGGWSGQHYAGEAGTGDAKTTGMVRVYSNAEAARSISFTSEAGEAIHGLPHATGAPTGDYTLVAGAQDPSAADPAASKEIGGFPTTGTTTYEEDDTVTGTYMGAAGTYKCVTASCTSAAAGASGIDLGTGWTFTPAGGATVQQKDASYLHFGWWVRQDKDGATHAGVIYGSGGTTALTEVTGINDAALVGKATYMGGAAGKFAVSDPLRPGEDNAGHFTADAELTADFKATGSTLSGTIDAFRLNDGSADPGWSVELQKTSFATDTFATDSDATTADRTVWSIGGNKSPASGSWQAQLFDHKAMDDDSNVPDAVVGSFSSSIGTTHTMVGAFGAEKQ